MKLKIILSISFCLISLVGFSQKKVNKKKSPVKNEVSSNNQINKKAKDIYNMYLTGKYNKADGSIPDFDSRIRFFKANNIDVVILSSWNNGLCIFDRVSLTPIINFGKYEPFGYTIIKMIDEDRYMLKTSLIGPFSGDGGLIDLKNGKQITEFKYWNIYAIDDYKVNAQKELYEDYFVSKTNTLEVHTESTGNKKKFKVEFSDSNKNKLVLQEINGNKSSPNSDCDGIQVPNYTVGEWRSETFGSGQWTTVFIGGYSSTFYYKESLTGKNYYSHGCNGEWYDTLENAIRAYYLCAKCGIVSEKGRL